MTARRTMFAAVLLAVAWLTFLAIGAFSAQLAGAAARPVGLADARSAPQTILYVRPGGRYDTLDGVSQCKGGGYWTEVSAYGWRGDALPAQRWTDHRTLMTWGRVTFDGVTVTNGYRHAILFAGWCS